MKTPRYGAPTTRLGKLILGATAIAVTGAIVGLGIVLHLDPLSFVLGAVAVVVATILMGLAALRDLGQLRAARSAESAPRAKALRAPRPGLPGPGVANGLPRPLRRTRRRRDLPAGASGDAPAPGPTRWHLAAR